MILNIRHTSGGFYDELYTSKVHGRRKGSILNQMKQRVIVLSSALLLAACSPAASDKAAVEQTTVKRVAVTQVKEEAFGQVAKWSGILTPVEETQVSFEINGRIVTLLAEAGDYVETGSVLASLDGRDLSLQAASAAASVQQAKAQLAQVTNGARAEEVLQAQNNLDKAKALMDKAKADLQRSEVLFRQGALSTNDWENVQNKAALAEKDWENAKETYALVAEGPRQEQKQQTAGVYRQAVVGQQRATLTQTKADLTAPISGVVLEKLASVGQLTSTSTPVYRIGNVDALLIQLAVPDRDIGFWKKGDEVTVTLYDQKRSGIVQRVSPAASQGSGTVPVEVRVENPDRAWLAGQVATVVHEHQGPKGIFVPVQAVQSRGETQPYVFVVRDNKAAKVPVTLGTIVDNQLQITSGLTIGEQVVTKGAEQLFAGDTLEVSTGERP